MSSCYCYLFSLLYLKTIECKMDKLLNFFYYLHHMKANNKKDFFVSFETATCVKYGAKTSVAITEGFVFCTRKRFSNR